MLKLHHSVRADNRRHVYPMYSLTHVQLHIMWAEMAELAARKEECVISRLNVFLGPVLVVSKPRGIQEIVLMVRIFSVAWYPFANNARTKLMGMVAQTLSKGVAKYMERPVGVSTEMHVQTIVPEVPLESSLSLFSFRLRS